MGVGVGGAGMDTDSHAFRVKFTSSCLLLQPVDSPECQNS